MPEKWRLIIDTPGDACENMAKDEAIGLCVKEGRVPCTLRLYQWAHRSVTIGRYQRASEVNLKACRARDIPVVRRPTGGRAILHGRDLTYSFSAITKGPYFSGGLLETYSIISRAFLVAFKKLDLPVAWKSRREKGRVLAGSPLCFQSISFGEITLKGRKVMGSAQKRWEGGFLQQGTIMLEIEPDLQEELFSGIKGETLRQSMIGLLEVRPELTLEAISAAIVQGFEEVFGVSFEVGGLGRQEQALMRSLLREKYLRAEYLLQR